MDRRRVVAERVLDARAELLAAPQADLGAGEGAIRRDPGDVLLAVGIERRGRDLQGDLSWIRTRDVGRARRDARRWLGRRRPVQAERRREPRQSHGADGAGAQKLATRDALARA